MPLWVGAGMLVACLCAHAQLLPSMLPGAAEPASAAASAPVLSADELASMVANAQEQVRRLDATASSQPDAPLLARRRQAAERLVALLQMRQLRAGPQAAQAPAAGSAPAAPLTLPPGLAGAPPFSALAVDALRDQRDALQIQQKALQASLESLDEQATVLLQARRSAAERTRLNQERIDTAAATGDTAEARAALELHQLEERGAAEELALLDLERTHQRARLFRLEAPLQGFSAQLARVKPTQKLDDADLAEIQRRSEPLQQWVSQERRRLVSRLAGRTSMAAADSAGAAARETDALQLTLRFL